MTANPNAVEGLAELDGWRSLHMAVVQMGWPASMCAKVIPLWPNRNWTQDQAMVAYAIHCALTRAEAAEELLSSAAFVQVTPDPSFPTFDFDFGDMGAAMAALPSGTKFVRIVPDAALRPTTETATL